MRVLCSHCGSSYSVPDEKAEDGPLACRICGHGIAIPSPSAKPGSPPGRAPAAQSRAPAPHGGGSAARKAAPLRAVPPPEPEATPEPTPVPEAEASAWNDRAAGPALASRNAPLPAPPGDGYIDLTIDDVPTPGPRFGEAPPLPVTSPSQGRAPSVPVPPSPTAVPPAAAPRPATARAPPSRPAASRPAPPPAAAPAREAAGSSTAPRAAPASLAKIWIPLGGAAVVLLAAGGFLLLRGRSGQERAAPATSEPARYVISTEAPPLAEAAPGIVEPARAAAAIPPAPSPEPAVRRGVARPEPRRADSDRLAPRTEQVLRTPAAQPAPSPAPAAPAAVRVEAMQIAAAAPAASPPEQAPEDAPAYATAEFRKPQTEVPGCVQNALRIPTDLQQFLSGPVTVRFAVGRDGAVSRFEVLGDVPHPKIAEAIRQAVGSCKFVPGADPQGKPTWLWLVMPIRFVAR